ncbi:MAG: CDP-glycerol glycerophosphotransferase family protein [Clostridia bacterium]|nr:CDP-glycerol glycerophosphotransferase family protein [Clostridia bacterium]
MKQLIKKIKPIYGALSAVRRIVMGNYMRKCHKKHGLDSNKVVFSSFKGASCSDSPLAIAKALHELRPETDIVFQLKADAAAPAWVRRAAPGSFGWLRELSTAKVTVDNFNKPFFQRKLPGQKYVQTWHGDRGFKRVLYDMDPNGGFPDYKDIDLAVAGSDFAVGMYRTAFRYQGEVLNNGLPRNDCLLEKMDIKETRRKCGLPEDKKAVLYAPTFRDSRQGGAFKPDFDIAAAHAALEAATGEEWVFVSRAHDKNTGVAGAVIDKTDFPEMSLLMQASDLLITDYSSCAGDFPLLERPVILFHSPERFERGLYFDVEKSPFMIAHSQQELHDLFYELGDGPQNAKAVLDFFGTHENGRSAYDVAERICQWLDE